MRCLPVLAAILLALAPVSGIAQTVPEQDATADNTRDLWCGVAFDLAVRDVPATAAPEVKTVTDPYRSGADLLIGRARSAYLELGLSEDDFADLVAETEADVTRQLSSTDPAITPPYSFEDCAALIGQ